MAGEKKADVDAVGVVTSIVFLEGVKEAITRGDPSSSFLLPLRGFNHVGVEYCHKRLQAFDHSGAGPVEHVAVYLHELISFDGFKRRPPPPLILLGLRNSLKTTRWEQQKLRVPSENFLDAEARVRRSCTFRGISCPGQFNQLMDVAPRGRP